MDPAVLRDRAARARRVDEDDAALMTKYLLASCRRVVAYYQRAAEREDAMLFWLA